MRKLAIAALLTVASALPAYSQTCTQAAPCAYPTPNPNPVQISTAGNGGRMTLGGYGAGQIYPLLNGTYTQSPAANGANPLMGDFSGAIQADMTGYYTSDAQALAAGGGTVVDSMPWFIYGTNSPYSCGKFCAGLDRTFMPDAPQPLVWIVPAAPAFNPDGSPVTGPSLCGSSICQYQVWAPISGAVALLADGTPAQFVHQSAACQPWGTCDSMALNQTPGNVLRPGTYLVYFTAAACTGRGCNIATGRYFFSAIPHVQSHYVASPDPPCTSECGDGVVISE